LSDAAEARERLIRVAESKDAPAEERSAAMHAIAHSYVNEGRADLAVEWFDRIVALPGAHPHHLCEARVARGYDLRARKAYREALAEFAAAFAVPGGLSIHRGSARYHSALTHLDLDEPAIARAELEAFLRMDPVYPQEKKNAEELLARLRA
jgi:tetratricopeptide (TPR) repeat protein